jgi:hypothetical protein
MNANIVIISTIVCPNAICGSISRAGTCPGIYFWKKFSSGHKTQ